ncbi:MAG: HAMP domain-containing protein [Bryobacteraceae bacterium]|nr:HAMP domain-containing protein [Bryobacteraceae bacterium]
MRRKLSFKLIVSLTLIVVMIKSIFGFITLNTQQSHLLDTMVLGADQLSKSITSATWQAMLDDHREVAYDIMTKIAEKQGVDRIRMYNGSGDLTFSTRSEDAGVKRSFNSPPCSSCHGKGAVKEQLTVDARARISDSPEGFGTLSMITPIYNEPACSQAACHAHPSNVKILGVLDVALRTDPIAEEEASIKFQTALSTLVQTGLIALCIVFFTRFFVTRPIDELIAGTKAVSAMELDRPIEIEHRSQEMDELVSSFNTMRERLGDAMDKVNQFTQGLEEKVEERTQQLKAAHQKLLHSDRLASLGQLSASVAHEINNPISGVLNLSMLCQRILKDDSLPPERVPELKKYLNQISRETSRVGRIVSDLLAFSRRSKPQRANADLNRLIQSTVSLVEHKLRLNEASIQFNLQPDLPLIPCDASQMQQVILNLVLNAAEAIQPAGGGKVTVSTQINSRKDAVELIVEDNGEGIPEENLDKIFTPFFTSKPDGKGVGLGLAVLYGIVEAHDGHVEVKSSKGLGSTFTVTLPLAPATHAEARA